MKHISINYILTTALALGIGISIPVLIGSTCLSEQHSVQSEVPYCVTPPTVPEQAVFDGDTIDLRRYDRRERMDRELMSFIYMHSSTMQMIKRANRYFPVIEPLLKANGIPDDFKYLMVIESNLNPIARSPAGAAGLWQFMPVTAREFGLEVNDNVDERYHIEKATAAACRYFKQAYAKYGDWMAVSASYNAGQGRISSQLDKQLADHAMDLWLAEETSRYMFRNLYFIPMDEHGIRQLRLMTVPEWKERLLELLFDPDVRTYDRGLFEYDAKIGDAYVFSHLDGDLARLVRFKEAVENQCGNYFVFSLF